jgi:hypothetical protein
VIIGICNVHSIELIKLLKNLELYEQDIGLLYIHKVIAVE